jgi:hypothetical protein
MIVDVGHSEYEVEVGGLVIRNDLLGPKMIVGDVFKEAGIVWLKFKCDNGESTWPASLFVPA